MFPVIYVGQIQEMALGLQGACDYGDGVLAPSPSQLTEHPKARKPPIEQDVALARGARDRCGLGTSNSTAGA